MCESYSLEQVGPEQVGIPSLALYSPDVSVSEIKGTLLLLSKYGLTPDARAHITPIPRKQASPLAELRSRRAKAV